MADLPDAPFAPYEDQLRSIPDLTERWATFVDLASHLEHELERFRRRQRQEIARGLKDKGKTWREVGEVMGGVTYQRAHQFGQGE
ncbi:hypothetical protein L0F81_00115 [Streptomyces tricolor]|uniref:Uncharacterized protein n=1 Tax=Streptomyces tricolor TaxID=68277 RepID=A0ABS9J823_9ACTN|nr:hypothetical protein [Streptomyces tricolor]MCG0061703.1 hypothetical protein [Streptomyces tricolor]